ncbi:MAG: peptidoglycan-binding protein, partial [Eubacteriales bacterium]|nr:peptidoglycan-binding protein [Eubacteriales bacterium]
MRIHVKNIALVLCAVMLVGWLLPAAVAQAAPSQTLKEGSSGSEVKAVQQELISQGYLKGKADGKFGASTAAAVKAFQKAKGLKQDGAVGATTWEKLMGDDNATPTLRLGDENASVKTLQILLIEKKYLKGKADGKFGNGTLTAVKAFQKANKLTADGTVGAATWKKLKASAATTTASSGSSRATLRIGASGDDVKTLQTALIKQGYLKGSADGKFGNSTLQAVKKFQKAMSVTSDGVAGPTTWALLMFTRSLRQGSSGEDVKELQTI